MMRVYYNEIDSFCVAWLRELMTAGEIPAGDVDDRSIVEVQPDDLKGYDQAHFFAGIGGWPYALRLAGWGNRPVWTGSCPCQPFSAAGKQQGHADPRHLWPEWFRLIRECRPEHVLGEQVAGAIGHGWLDLVSADLEREGYAIGACVLGAHSVGAPHIRQRLWFVADRTGAGQLRAEQPQDHRASGPRRGANDTISGSERLPCGVADCEQPGLERHSWDGAGGIRQEREVPESNRPVSENSPPNGESGNPWADLEWLPCRDGKARPTLAILQFVPDGISAELGVGGDESQEARQVNGTPTIDGPAPGVPALWCGVGQETVRNRPRGSGGVQAPEILRSAVHGTASRGKDQGAITEGGTASGDEDHETVVRDVRQPEAAARPSSGREPNEQQPDEPPDVVRFLPSAGAFAVLGRDDRTTQALSVLQATREEARLVLDAQHTVGEVWRSLGPQGQTRLLVGIREVGLMVRPLSPLASGVSNRIGLLKGAGNAIVPQVAAAFVSAYMETQ